MNDCKINAFKAVERGDCRKLKEFLASGEERGVQKMDPKYNATLLHWAALRNQVACVEICIKAGADLEAKTDTNGTPLMWACMEGSFDAVTSLLRYGADVNSVTTSLATPMHHAASYGHAEAVSILLAHGASPAVVDVYGNHPGDKFFNDVSEDCRRKVIKELEGARGRSSMSVRLPKKVSLGSRLWKEEEEVHSCTIGASLGGEYGKIKKHDSSLLRTSSPSDAIVSINDLIHKLDGAKATVKTALEELKESEAAVVAAISARKNRGENYHTAVAAMEEAASALALELHPREERLTSLESDFRSREIEFKNALEAKEKENNELKCRLEGVSGAVDSIWRLSSQDSMNPVSNKDYSQTGYDAVAGDNRGKKNDKNRQMDEVAIFHCHKDFPEANATCGIPTPTHTSSWHEQRASMQKEQNEEGGHGIAKSSSESALYDGHAHTAADQSLAGWQSGKDNISEIPYLYSLLAAGK